MSRSQSLEVTPLTGRKHQIRIHLAHAGFPIVGDKLYGSDELRLRLVERRQTDDDRRALRLTSPRCTRGHLHSTGAASRGSSKRRPARNLFHSFERRARLKLRSTSSPLRRKAAQGREHSLFHRPAIVIVRATPACERLQARAAVTMAPSRCVDRRRSGRPSLASHH